MSKLSRRATDQLLPTEDTVNAAIALAIRNGFDRHYALFRYNSQQAKSRYEAGDWHAIRKLARERIAFYDERVREAVELIGVQFRDSQLAADNWAQVRRHFVNLLAEHRQPELAEK